MGRNHIFTTLNQILYQAYNLQSAYAGDPVPGPAEMDCQAVAAIKDEENVLCVISLRSRELSMEAISAERPGNSDGQSRLEFILSELSEAVLAEFSSQVEGCFATLLSPSASLPPAPPALAFAMVAGATPLEVRLWKT